MSSRALRRAQRELEEKQLQEKLAQEEQEQEQDESEEEVAPKAKAKPSLFAMLGDGGDDQDEEDDEDVDQQEPASERKADVDVAPSSKPKKSKKKKRKGKSKNAAAGASASTANSTEASGLDEIDQALLALSLTANGQTSTEADQSSTISEEVKQLCSVLRVDTQHLHAANEMKKLFGRAALQNTDDEAQARPRGQGGIAAAVAGRNAPGARGLASLGLRRNIFVQGKEEWPRATSGGLGMEIVEKRADGTVQYRFVHNRAYQEVQQQFEVCVGSMDPERMIQLLHFNRKHPPPCITR
jgi:hypothetical protein